MPHSTSANGTSPIEIVPLPAEQRGQSLLGAEVKLNSADLDHLSPDDCQKLVDALHEHSVLVVRNAGIDSSSTTTSLCHVFDQDSIDLHSAGNKPIREAVNILSRNQAGRMKGNTNVVVIGNGSFPNYDGGEDLHLRHVVRNCTFIRDTLFTVCVRRLAAKPTKNQAEFHATTLTEEELAQGQTRFYRWHIDAPLYDRNPGKVTIISCRETPGYLPDQTIKFESGKEKKVYPGGTTFISGARAFSLLTPEEKEWAMNTRVQYAPRAYFWIGDCKATSDGLTIESQGKERDFNDLEPWTWDKVHNYPLVWRNPGRPDRPHLIVLGCCVYQLITTDPKTGEKTVIEDFEEARRKIHDLMKRTMSPEYVYHSVTGELKDAKRLMWQASQGSNRSPVAARWDEVDISGKLWSEDKWLA